MRWSKYSALLTPAYAAALALVVIQVGIGLIYKSAAQGGSKSNYGFSPSSSVTLSEFLKLLLSTAFFYGECRQRYASSSSGYRQAATTSAQDSFKEKAEVSDRDLESPESLHETSTLNNTGESPRGLFARDNGSHLGLKEFFRCFGDEVPADAKYGFIQLAMLYSLLNNSVCGLLVTQYRPETGSAYPFTTYLLLVCQTILSACAGVYNQKLCKSQDASLHADNMILYAAGASINLLIYFTVKLLKSDEPGFFVGYGTPDAVMVLLSNIFIGLAVTAVYKYANALTKCFATAVSTGILLYVSPILFATQMSFLVLPGTLVAFIATWLYVEATPPKETNKQAPASAQPTSLPWLSRTSAVLPVKHLGRNVTVGLCTIGTVMITTALFLSSANISIGQKHEAHDFVSSSTTVRSPFENTLAFIRINNKELDMRVPKMRAYEPFFQDIHISKPDDNHPNDDRYTNITRDYLVDVNLVYKAVADTMQLILDAPPDSRTAQIQGVMYFHFDAWIDPLGFRHEDFDNFWLPDGEDPKYMCMTDASEYADWWSMKAGFHENAKQSARALQSFDLGYVLNPDEFCSGWSDIYYIPRRFFTDFVFLSSVFGARDTHHEIAIPTMLHIIDNTRRPNPLISLTSLIGDCWGDCCAKGPRPRDILGRRCGHPMDYRNEDWVKPHFSRLEDEAALLGHEMRQFGAEDTFMAHKSKTPLSVDKTVSKSA
ncbi:MAG: hypothetical protein Q9217_001929 [Psora testacea]